MPGVPQAFDDARDRATFHRPAHRRGVELYHAHIVRHAFAPHAHDGFGLGLVEHGVERFRWRGSEHLAARGALVTMNADELHTGRAAAEEGWRYRMVYVEPAVIEAVTGERGWHFAEAVRHDAAGAARVAARLDALWAAREPLAFDDALAALVDAYRPHARVAAGARPEGTMRFAAVLEHLRAHLAERLTLEALAAVAGLSPFHFQRAFRARHHASPHELLMALRLQEAKRRLAAGEAPAAVAAAVGLADQAHLTRAFAQRYGTTPARYRRQVAG